MSPVALWLPFEVSNLDAAMSFYTERVGLTAVDRWDRDGERGAVLRAGGAAFVELVSPVRAGAAAPPLAFELANSSEVDTRYAVLHPRPGELVAPPHHYPRGHYGFEVRAPAGATVMLWSERT